MKRVMIRYRVKPERAAENEALVRGVYDELSGIDAPDFRYATFKLEDGVSFVHLAEIGEAKAPLPGLKSFQKFQDGLLDRCDEPPVQTELTEVGRHRLFE